MTAQKGPGRKMMECGGEPFPLFPLFVKCYHGRSKAAGHKDFGKDTDRAGESRTIRGSVKASD